MSKVEELTNEARADQACLKSAEQEGGRSIEQLIQQYCPDGVEFVPLGEVCDIHKGVQFNKSDMNDTGTYPVINGGINPSGYVEVFNEDKDTITISQGGASAGYVNFLKSKFWLGAHCYAVIPDKRVLNRYLYHFTKQNEVILQQCQYGAGIPALAKGTISSLEIPVPPLPIQEEIVRILDTFTELQAELQAELQKRKQQYNYYRDKLLSFEGRDDVEWKKLGEVEKMHCSGSTPSKSKKDYYEGGNIPWLRTQDVKFNEITDVDCFITEKALKETAVKWIPENCVIIAISGATAGRCAINKIRTTTNQHCLNIDIDNSKALYKYVFYCVCNQYEELISLKQGARGDLNTSSILGLKIPIPSLSEQQRIVSILDRFDSLVNNLSQGLPAEIEARKQQYEYYRDQLLTFKRKEV